MDNFPTSSLTRYYHLIELLERLVQRIDNEYPNDPRWFLFSLRVGRKLLFHAKSFCLHSADTIFNEDTKKEEDNSFVDISGLFSNLRAQIDCFSTLNHIFFDDVDWETKRLRFDLWRYDSHIERINLGIGDESDLTQLSELKLNIERNSNFQSYEVAQQKFIFNHDKHFSNWKFIPSKLSRKEHKTKWVDLFRKTGIKESEMNKAYGFLSMYIHSNFFSVAHLTEMDRKESNESRNYAILFSSFILCFAIDDFISKFTPGKEFLSEMKQLDFEIVQSFIEAGRIKEKNKNFA